MSTFKSFKPPKYSRHKRYKDNNYSKILNLALSILCSNCGYPYGRHSGTNCPDYIPEDINPYPFKK